MTSPFSPYAGLGPRIRRCLHIGALLLEGLLPTSVVLLLGYGYYRASRNSGNHFGFGIVEPMFVLMALSLISGAIHCLLAKQLVRVVLAYVGICAVGLGAAYPLYHCNFLVSYEVYCARHLAGPDRSCCGWFAIPAACREPQRGDRDVR